VLQVEPAAEGGEPSASQAVLPSDGAFVLVWLDELARKRNASGLSLQEQAFVNGDRTTWCLIQLLRYLGDKLQLTAVLKPAIHAEQAVVDWQEHTSEQVASWEKLDIDLDDWDRPVCCPVLASECSHLQRVAIIHPLAAPTSEAPFHTAAGNQPLALKTKQHQEGSPAPLEKSRLCAGAAETKAADVRHVHTVDAVGDIDPRFRAHAALVSC